MARPGQDDAVDAVPRCPFRNDAKEPRGFGIFWSAYACGHCATLPFCGEAYSYGRASPAAALAGILNATHPAPVAQLDRAPDYESGGQEFESLRARQLSFQINNSRGRLGARSSPQPIGRVYVAFLAARCAARISPGGGNISNIDERIGRNHLFFAAEIIALCARAIRPSVTSCQAC